MVFWTPINGLFNIQKMVPRRAKKNSLINRQISIISLLFINITNKSVLSVTYLFLTVASVRSVPIIDKIFFLVSDCSSTILRIKWMEGIFGNKDLIFIV